MLSHVKKVHSLDPLQACSVCQEKFYLQSQLDIHIRENHLADTDPRRYFPCELCDVKCDTNRRLSHHKSTLHKKDSAKFTCDYCKLEFNTLSLIAAHMPIHSGIFVRRSRSDNDNAKGDSLLIEEPDQSKQAKIGIALDKGTKTLLKSPYNMESHQNSATGDVPMREKHECSFCGKTFARRGNLAVHENIHTS